MRLSDDQIRTALDLQVIAKFLPNRIGLPDNWNPSTQLDKFIYNNMPKTKWTIPGFKEYKCQA